MVRSGRCSGGAAPLAPTLADRSAWGRAARRLADVQFIHALLERDAVDAQQFGGAQLIALGARQCFTDEAAISDIMEARKRLARR